MKYRSVTVFIIFLVLCTPAFFFTGCNSSKSNPSGPDASGSSTPVVGNVKSLSFRIVLSDGRQLDNGLNGNIRAAGDTSPEATFKVRVVNVGNSANPTSSLIKKVQVINGAATASFKNVPAKPVICDVSIKNGNISGHSSFHGAGDLVADKDNVVEIAPKASKTMADYLAEVLERLIADTNKFKDVNLNVVSQIEKSLENFDRHSGNYDAGMSTFESYTPKNEETEIDLGSGIKMNLVVISNGSFLMGDATNTGLDEERPTRTVGLANSYYVGKYEVTQEQYQRIMGTNPSYFQGGNSYSDSSKQPVDQVKWFDAVEFCNKLSLQQGLTPCYTIQKSSDSQTVDSVSCDWSANGYRLPTEAEWEYFCRAGTTTKFSWGDSDDESTAKQYAWYGANAYKAHWTSPHAEKNGTQPVGAKSANPWGLHDMHGNVWEWCWDFYGSTYYTQRENVDPRGPASGLYRILRGGHLGQGIFYLRSAYRTGDLPTRSSAYSGFRVIRLKTGNSVSIPATPAGLAVTSEDGKNSISWNSVSGASSYNVYFSTSSGISKNNGTKLTNKTSPFSHTGLTNGTTYYYVVTAVNSAGESNVSSEKSAKPVASSSDPTEIDLGDSIKMNFVAISKGSFKMGRPDATALSDNPQRTVSIGSNFLMGKYEVTQEQYKKVMGVNPSYYQGSRSYSDSSKQPVETVTWYNAVDFCNKLSSSQSLTPCYTNSAGSTTIVKGTTVFCNWGANGYRLPTEAEWEYCCRANTLTKYSWGDSNSESIMKQYAWYELNAYDGHQHTWTEPHAEKHGTQPVGTKSSNSWGLHDMHGNVEEWCWDWYGSYSDTTNSDPRGPNTGSNRVKRGGAWSNSSSILYSYQRASYGPTSSGDKDLGFRVLRAQ